MYYYNFIMGWGLFILFLISFMAFIYLFGIREPGGWKGLCAFVLAFFFVIPSSHFLRVNQRAHVAEEVRLGRQVEACGVFVRMDGSGYIVRGRESPNAFAVFLIEKKEIRFGDFFYHTKDIIMSLKKDDPVCIQYVKGPFPRRTLIIVKVSKDENKV
jgi:hypothetical protein